MLEPVAPAKPDDDLDLDDVRQRIADATDEIAQLRAVPTPSPDVEKQIKAYVAALARPRVSGVASGQQLRVDWPNDLIAVLALLQPEQMVAALMKEVDRHANTPLPLDRAQEAHRRIGGGGRQRCNAEHWRSVPMFASCPPPSCWE